MEPVYGIKSVTGDHPAKLLLKAKQRSYKPGQNSYYEEKAPGPNIDAGNVYHNWWLARYKRFEKAVHKPDYPKIKMLINGLSPDSTEWREASKYLNNMIAKKLPAVSSFLWEDVILWGVRYNVLGQRNFEKNNLANPFSEYPMVTKVISGIDDPSLRAAAASFATEMINEYDSRLAMYINLFIQHKETAVSGLLSKAVVGEIQDSPQKRRLAEDARKSHIAEYDNIFSLIIRHHILREKYVWFPPIISRVVPTYPFNGYRRVNKLIEDIKTTGKNGFDKTKAITLAAKGIFERPSATAIAEWEESVVSLLEGEKVEEVPPPPPPPPPIPVPPPERTLEDCPQTKELIDNLEAKKRPFAKEARSLAESLITMGLGDRWICDEVNRVFVMGTPSLKEFQDKKCDDPRFEDALSLARQIFAMIKERDFEQAGYSLGELSSLLEELSRSKTNAKDDSCFSKNYMDFYVHYLLLELEKDREKQVEINELVGELYKSADSAMMKFKTGEVNGAFEKTLHAITIWDNLKGKNDIQSISQRQVTEQTIKHTERIARVLFDLTNHPKWYETDEIDKGELATFFRTNLVPICLAWIENGNNANYPFQGTLNGMVEKALRVVTRKPKFPYEVPISSRQNPKKLRCEAEMLDHRIRELMGFPERFGHRAYYSKSEFNEAGKETTNISKQLFNLNGQAKHLFAQKARYLRGPYDQALTDSLAHGFKRFRNLSNSYVHALDTSLDAALELEVLIQKVKKIGELMRHLYERLKLLPYQDSPFVHESYRQDLLPAFQKAVRELLNKGPDKPGHYEVCAK